MAKVLNKTAALAQLQELVKKQAAIAQTNISGEPGKDTNISSVSESNETTNQNAVGPEELNGKQGPEQKPAKDDAAPLAAAKTANEDLNKVATDLLNTIRESISKEGKAQTDISGKPGKDTNIASVSAKNETTDQNAVGPEELNGKQGPEQKPSKDDAAPVKAAAFGKAFFEALTKRAAEVRQDTAEAQRFQMCKAAGRADLETLVNHALSELEAQKQAHAAEQEKQAEIAGATYFDEIYKQAAAEYAAQKQAEELESLKVKLAAFEAKAAPAVVTPTATTGIAAEDMAKIAKMVADDLKSALAAK